MTRRFPPGRYILPEDNDAEFVYCCVPVPNDVNHRAAFWGQMEDLASARIWQDDPGHNALLAAAKWRQIVDGLTLVPGACVEGQYCAQWDFSLGDFSDVWSPVGFPDWGGTPVYNTDGWEVAAASSGSANLFCTIKLTTVDPFMLNYARIRWTAVPGSACASTVGVIVEHADSGGNSGAFVLTDFHGFSWNDSSDTTAHGSFFSTEHFIQIQMVNDGSGVCSGLLKIQGVNLYGTGQPPPGAITC
jgi:hypothetical protein